MKEMGNSFWVSNLINFKASNDFEKKNLGNDWKWTQEGIWTDLENICDGVKLDSFVETESTFHEELADLFPQIKKMENNNKEKIMTTLVPVKIYVWYNFRLNLQTIHNCKRGILTLGSSGLGGGYELLSHLRSTFSFNLDERRKPLFDLFNKSVIQGGLFSDLISCSNTAPAFEVKKRARKQDEKTPVDFFENLCYSNCKVLNCLEHLDFTLNVASTVSVKTIMDYLNKEFVLIRDYSSTTNHKDSKFDIISSLLGNDASQYNFSKCNNTPIEVWWNVFDFLDDYSLAQIKSLNKSLNFMWLTYHRNDLLPHQRRSVAWLLERESRSGRGGAGHWSFESPVRFLTSSDDTFKYLSVWHYLSIKDISQAVKDANNLEEVIVWGSGDQEKCLLGVKMHPKHLANSNQLSRTAFLKDSSISLYMNHASKTIHLGFSPKSTTEFKSEEYGQTRGGVFCDEPGLGKTLTVLSLISKTSNIHKKSNSNGISYFEYPHGVIQFLYNLNHQGDFEVNFMGIGRSSCPSFLKLNHTNFNLSKPCELKDSTLNLIPSKSTLIIAPNHLIQHWVEEIKKWYKTDVIIPNNTSTITENKRILPNHDEINIYLFDDPSKDEIIESLDTLAKSNIVLLSYRMLTRQFQLCKVKQNYKRASVNSRKEAKTRQKKDQDQSSHLSNDPFFRPEKSQILRIKWLRLIVDEGHNIGNSEISSTLYQQFIFKIKSEFKWIMSGTPLPISITKSINTSLANILKFLQLPIVCDRTRCYELESSIRSSRRSVPRESQDEKVATSINSQTHCSLLKWISKSSHHHYHKSSGNAKLLPSSPIGLFAITTQIGSIIVLNQKGQCPRNFLPSLIGPSKKVIQPFIKNEFNIYKVLCELTQRNLFCTYFSQENVDSLLHPSNVNYRHEVIWNFRFASILGFSMNIIKDSLLLVDDNNSRLWEEQQQLLGSMNLPPVPFISVSDKDIQELRLMLENTHPSYENDHFHPPESYSRLEFVLEYFTSINLSSSSSCNCHKCDSCNDDVLFPLIIPCPKIHLVCIYCIMRKLGYHPVKVDLSLPEENDSVEDSPCQKSNKFYWPKRGPISFCVVCGEDCQINPDFFDRLQVPIQISYIGLNRKTNDSSPSRNSTSASSRTGNLTPAAILPLPPSFFSSPLTSRLKTLLINDYKSSEIESILRELYQRFANIIKTSDGMSNYIHHLPVFGESREGRGNLDFIPLNQEDISPMFIGLISLSSSKLRYVLHCILENIKKNPKVKIMVISSLWQQLDFLYYTLTAVLNIGTCRYYPHIPKSELNKSISSFKNEHLLLPVLLLSIDIGSHGLDLSCVSNMYILDPISDESVENQTISRAHRIRSDSSCSSSTVKVKYCLTQDTFEDLLYDYIQCKRRINQRKKVYRDSSSSSPPLSQIALHEDDLDRVKRSRKVRRRTKMTSFSSLSSASSSSHGGNSHIRKHTTTPKDSTSPALESCLDMELNPESASRQEPNLFDLDPTQLLLRVFLKQKKHNDQTERKEAASTHHS